MGAILFWNNTTLGVRRDSREVSANRVCTTTEAEYITAP